MTAQLNATVPAVIAGKIRADARRNRRAVNVVVGAILEDFFRSWTLTERANFYAAHPAKRAGRPIRP